MRLRVIRCPADAHELPWIKADACEHWARKCASGRKNKHQLKRGAPGYLVLPTTVDHAGVAHLYTEPKWFVGNRRQPPAPGNLLTCAACGLKGAE